MDQTTIQINIITCREVPYTVRADATVEDLMRQISEEHNLEIDDVRVPSAMLYHNMRLGVFLPTGPERISDRPMRDQTLASLGIADGTELFLGIEPIEVWEILFDFLRRNSYNIVSAEREFGGRDACVPIWIAGFNHIIENPDQQEFSFQIIQRTCVDWFEFTVRRYSNAAEEGCQYAHEQLLTLEEQFYGREVEFVDNISGHSWVVILGDEEDYLD
jgi:hypothetical protein